MRKSDFLTPAPNNYQWPQCPEADAFIYKCVNEFLNGHSFSKNLEKRMSLETNTEFVAWVDHLVLPKKKFSVRRLAALGFQIDKNGKTLTGEVMLSHPFADLPRLLLTSKTSLSCAIGVDSISDFLSAHHFSLPIFGSPCSHFRQCSIFGERGELRIIERRGTRSVVPDNKNTALEYLSLLEIWAHRIRVFSSISEGMKHTLETAKTLASQLGSGMAACVFLEGERRYWQSRNRIARFQKQRQDGLGLGWANHDHHTFRSSRAAFPDLIKILLTFGFKKRERFYAGAEAGWGAQVMEQPEARLIIFADVDLTPDEGAVDFTTTALPELLKPGTVGLWCALHGESILDAGMHHLEAKFDFEGLRNGLKNQGFQFMKPFSDFPHLRQAFSEGEFWPVSSKRLEALNASGRLSTEAYIQIKQNGAVGSHLENLQRRNGFKGFNQRGVSEIIRDVNPETQALKGKRA